VAEELTIGFLIPAVALELSTLSVLEGRAKDALDLVSEARAAIEEVGLRWWEALAELRMGEALFAAAASTRPASPRRGRSTSPASGGAGPRGVGAPASRGDRGPSARDHR
jgi:hypothetical protein